MGPGSRPGRRESSPPLIRIKREAGRLAAEIRRRVERLAVDRTVVVLARERWESDRRREGVVGELAIPRQNLGAAIKPGAPAHIDSGMRALLIDHIGAAYPNLCEPALLA